MSMGFEILRPALAKILEIEPQKISSSPVLHEFWQWYSFSRPSVVASITEHTGKQISVDELEKVVTVEDLIELFPQLQEHDSRWRGKYAMWMYMPYPRQYPPRFSMPSSFLDSMEKRK